MTETLLGLVPQYGLWLIGVTTFLSCLALPVPSSLMMLTAGGFAAAGDLTLWQVAAAALGGAILGDQTGFQIGRMGGERLLARLSRDPRHGRILDRAIEVVRQRASIGVFLTRWLFSPLGPYANFAGGAIGFDWRRFTLAAALGEAVWVVLYVGTGYVFTGNLEAASDMLGSVIGLLAAGAVTFGLGLWLRAALRHRAASAATDKA